MVFACTHDYFSVKANMSASEEDQIPDSELLGHMTCVFDYFL